jgi:alpha-tubulin suppressor-like RCC1 family protein
LGGYHSCGLKAGGSLWCWGYNDFGQLGLGDWTSHTTPTQVGTSIDWSTIILGGYHSCGIKDDGSALCWGYNGYGQLGLGDSGDGTERDTPTQVGTGADWSALTLGTYHSCGIKNDGSALCWGYNEYGQLGLSDSGDGTERDTPTQVGTDANWSAIALGAVHSCGPKSDGSLWCWGYNEFGQLGLGDSGTGTDRSTPTQVGTGTDWL